jgi:hypothetical protein
VGEGSIVMEGEVWECDEGVVRVMGEDGGNRGRTRARGRDVHTSIFCPMVFPVVPT